jgi:ElaB/YqjD/DUF883 family membrane-anchored ribosome-binding protein
MTMTDQQKIITGHAIAELNRMTDHLQEMLRLLHYCHHPSSKQLTPRIGSMLRETRLSLRDLKAELASESLARRLHQEKGGEPADGNAKRPSSPLTHPI